MGKSLRSHPSSSGSCSSLCAITDGAVARAVLYSGCWRRLSQELHDPPPPLYRGWTNGHWRTPVPALRDTAKSDYFVTVMSLICPCGTL